MGGKQVFLLGINDEGSVQHYWTDTSINSIQNLFFHNDQLLVSGLHVGNGIDLTRWMSTDFSETDRFSIADAAQTLVQTVECAVDATGNLFLSASANGPIHLEGTEGIPDEIPCTFVLKLDESMNPMWLTQFGDSSGSFIDLSAVLTPNRLMLFCFFTQDVLVLGSDTLLHDGEEFCIPIHGTNWCIKAPMFLLAGLQIGNATGVASQQTAEWKLYPNPASMTFQVSPMSMGTEQVHIRIYNAGGQIVHEEKRISGDLSAVQVDVLPRGMYVVEIINGTERLSKKLILK